jgi:hypothetical protein
MKKQNSLLLTGIALSILTACNSATKRDVNLVPAMEEKDTIARSDQAADQAIADSAGARSPANSSGVHRSAFPDFDKNPLLIKEADISTAVTDLAHSGKKIRQWLENEGGYYTGWEQARQADSLGISLTAKVPAGHFESFKDSVETLGNIEIESVQAADVTDTYQGSQGRMTTSQKIGDQYKHILQNATKPKDALAVQEKVDERLMSAEESSESVSSLHRQVATGTLHIRLAMFSPLPLPQAPFLGRRLLGNLEDGWEGLSFVLLFFAEVWPWLLLLVAGGLLWRRYRRIR